METAWKKFITVSRPRVPANLQKAIEELQIDDIPPLPDSPTRPQRPMPEGPLGLLGASAEQLEAFGRALDTYDAEMRQHDRDVAKWKRMIKRREQQRAELAERFQRSIDLGNEAFDELFTERAAA